LCGALELLTEAAQTLPSHAYKQPIGG